MMTKVLMGCHLSGCLSGAAQVKALQQAALKIGEAVYGQKGQQQQGGEQQADGEPKAQDAEFKDKEGGEQKKQ